MQVHNTNIRFGPPRREVAALSALALLAGVSLSGAGVAWLAGPAVSTFSRPSPAVSPTSALRSTPI